MRTQVFVDESKTRGLLVAAAVCVSGEVNEHRKHMRRLLLAGKRRIHFKKESDPRRRKILATTGVDLTVPLYGRATDDADGRHACLDAVVRDAAATAERLVIERDESTMAFDRRVLFDATRRHGCAYTLTYELLAPYADPMLWIPDAVAWCWNRGGIWRDTIAPFTVQHRL